MATVYLDGFSGRGRARDELERFFAVSRDLMAIVDLPAGRWLRINPAFTKVLGWTHEELQDELFWSLVHPEDLERTRETEREVVSGVSVSDFEIRILSDDGNYRWIAWDVSRYDADGLFYCVGRDVTEKHYQKAQLALHMTSKEAELHLAKEELRALTARLMTAQEDERRRIARDLHDSIVQQLATISTELCHASQHSAELNGSMKDILSRIHTRSEKLATEVRELSHRLHPSELEDVGLVAALRHLCEEFQIAHRVKTKVLADESRKIIPQLATTVLFRIAQEALRNVLKHGGKDASAIVRLKRGPNCVRLLVIDDGPGFEPSALVRRGLGLVSMKERARIGGGRLGVRSKPGEYTAIRAVIPLPHLAGY